MVMVRVFILNFWLCMVRIRVGIGIRIRVGIGIRIRVGIGIRIRCTGEGSSSSSADSGSLRGVECDRGVSYGPVLPAPFPPPPSTKMPIFVKKVVKNVDFVPFFRKLTLSIDREVE